MTILSTSPAEVLGLQYEEPQYEPEDYDTVSHLESDEYYESDPHSEADSVTEGHREPPPQRTHTAPIVETQDQSAELANRLEEEYSTVDPAYTERAFKDLAEELQDQAPRATTRFTEYKVLTARAAQQPEYEESQSIGQRASAGRPFALLKKPMQATVSDDVEDHSSTSTWEAGEKFGDFPVTTVSVQRGLQPLQKLERTASTGRASAMKDRGPTLQLESSLSPVIAERSSAEECESFSPVTKNWGTPISSQVPIRAASISGEVGEALEKTISPYAASLEPTQDTKLSGVFSHSNTTISTNNEVAPPKVQRQIMAQPIVNSKEELSPIKWWFSSDAEKSVIVPIRVDRMSTDISMKATRMERQPAIAAEGSSDNTFGDGPDAESIIGLVTNKKPIGLASVEDSPLTGRSTIQYSISQERGPSNFNEEVQRSLLPFSLSPGHTQFERFKTQQGEEQGLESRLVAVQ
ncbi:hypothetical protein CC78DRAFT_4739 [Lojkania enalia]|uniref:Uncharacterized protein n=1 Tax=Lojkania enalia TaxID=147567 RepID=A0A9P4NCS4_9PLEO|nr:hypothetical protein CC78DRAFT_4739 [Didymosphaeria enalia]